MSRIDLSEREEAEFSDTGLLTKTISILPAWLREGEVVQLGHWKAEVTTVSPKGSETDPAFVVGFRMRF